MKISQLQDGPAARPRKIFWLWLILAAAAPRVLAVFFLPNAFGDAYSYLHDVDVLSAKMANGTFSVKDLFGFWLPLYQLISSLISAVAGHPFYVARLVSALSGAGVCLLIYRIASRLTSDRRLSLAAFGLAALNPLHIFYSASALTDIPHSFLAMACLDAMMGKRVKTASVWAAAAGLARVESWMSILLLPAWQFLRDRKISLSTFAIPLLAPAIWLCLSRIASGNFFTYFIERHRYVADYTAANPAVAVFSFQRASLDAVRLIDSANFAVLAGCLAGAWLAARRLKGPGFMEAVRGQLDLIAANVFFLANLGFILLAYLTGNQPEIWSRYGLLLFSLGLPVLAWTFKAIEASPLRLRVRLAAVVLAVFFLQMSAQVVETLATARNENSKTEIGLYLRKLHLQHPDRRFLCDDVAVRYASGIPWEKFVHQWGFPSDPAAWEARLRSEKVGYLTCGGKEVSAAAKLFPELREGKGNRLFRPVKGFKRKVWVYQVVL